MVEGAQCAKATGCWLFLQRLLSTLAPSAVDNLLRWTPENAGSLEALNERLKTSDPSSLAKQKRDTCVQVTNIVKGIKIAVAAFGAEQIQTIRTQRSPSVIS
ncbi:hypothetical protein [Pseudomonas syringae]|uniref:Uncharacterized protein n=2 Tax=Pseudomonas syringae TaxID=317 RepID=A0AA43DX53_PSESX|nr:hypothetical protein [Pseudomonas syringae]MDH4606887.1 hypothetical protein [Pseudomonas syringae pv. papulans]MDH4624356.1 hypothetical protein [Pseudomonas syringae pv. papulans]